MPREAVGETTKIPREGIEAGMPPHRLKTPILADALEEAGCTNTDLLDSCRTGDPDIDGVWVLRVLFGER